MTDKSQELAISLLEEAKEKGTLDPAIESRLAKLIGAEARPKVEEALGSSVAAEPEKAHELSPEDQEQLLSGLEDRFNRTPAHYNTPEFRKQREGVDFAQVRAALEASPELMWRLNWMEQTGGQPDFWGEENGEFIFRWSSAESPDGRRDLTYDQAAEMAKEFGVDMMSEDAYRAMQKSGEFDLKTWIWLKTPADIRDSGFALDGYRNVDDVRVDQDDAGDHSPREGWRGLLRVPKA